MAKTAADQVTAGQGTADGAAADGAVGERWIPVQAGTHTVTLRDGAVVCRNAKGRELRAVPPALRDDPAVVGLRQLSEWLERHAAECLAAVDRWMVRSLPVPAAVLARVWPDEAWRAAWRDLVVAGLDAEGRWDRDEVGFVRDVDADGVRVVTLDGETVRLTQERIIVPHPVLLADLEELREFAADLDVRQGVDQLFRETWAKPVDADPQARAVRTFAGGRFKELRHALGRATASGYRMSGGNAVLPVVEGGRTVEARYWLGADDPSWEAETGDLCFVGADGAALPLGQVGPVAWSEGHRMAAAVYAGRVVDGEEQE